MGFLLHVGAAVACTIPVIFAQAAEITDLNQRPLRTANNTAFTPSLGVKGHYGSDFGNTSESVISDADFSAVAVSEDALSTTRILTGHYEFNAWRWQFKPYIPAGFGTVDLPQKPLGYASGDWAIYRGSGSILGLSPKPSESLNTIGTARWETHLGLVPKIPTKLGIPDLKADQHGLFFGADYHF